MRMLAVQCVPGAGSERVVTFDPRRVRVRTSMRGLTRLLRHRQWINESRLLRVYAEELSSHGCDHLSGARVARLALDMLLRDALVWACGGGRRRAVRLNRGEAVPPTRNAPRGRRRRRPDDSSDERPASRRRVG